MLHPWKFNSSLPLKIYHPNKERLVFQTIHFSGSKLSIFRGVQLWASRPQKILASGGGGLALAPSAAPWGEGRALKREKMETPMWASFPCCFAKKKSVEISGCHLNSGGTWRMDYSEWWFTPVRNKNTSTKMFGNWKTCSVSTWN